MTLDEISEAKTILATMLSALGNTLAGATGTPAADLLYGIGDLEANADTYLRAGAIGAPLLACFNDAVAAGATIASMELVRLAMEAEVPQSVSAVALTNSGIRMALAAEVQILAATTFASRQDIDAALDALVAAFDPAVEYAADSGESAVFQALIAAQAASVTDLNSRAQSLPALVTYSFGRVMTSLALAQRLYGDASRADELCALNKVVDPTFMPATGVALSE